MLWKWLCHSSYAVPAVCAPVIDGSSRSIVTLLFLSMGILSGTPGLLSHWHPHRPVTSFMLQVLSFEAAAPLFSLPQYSCYVHLWCCISKWVALCSQLLPHHKAVEQQGFTNQYFSSLLSGCFTSDLGYYKFIYKILPASLKHRGFEKQDIHSRSFLSELWRQDSMTWCSKCTALHAIKSSGQSRAKERWYPKHRQRTRALK